jgi:tRNA(fMet)-specific endonuclease VapC
MAESLILETTFMIDLERELLRSEEGPAQAFLERHLSERLHLTFTVAGELAAGPMVDQRQRWESFISPFQVLTCNKDVCWEYGKTYRYLHDNGLLIGSNDLWIAATALAHGMPVVTRNEQHFRRVPGLRVMSYAGAGAD